MELRPYQSRIVGQAEASGNTVVVLPTGAGKTLIAAELIKRVGGTCLFLVPTCLLVEQQAKAVGKWTKLSVGEYMGGATLPSRFQVLVSTPKAFQVAQAKGTVSLAWSAFRLVVFDEVHHVLKDHPYRKLAQHLAQVNGSAPRVLGLTASLTYAVGEKQVEAAIRRLCTDLRIASMASATDEELRSSGYHALKAKAEVEPVDIPGAVPAGVVPAAWRKPHMMHETFFERLRNNTSTLAAQRLYAAVSAMEAQVSSADPEFRTPLHNRSLKAWGEYANRNKDRSPLYAALEHWYEALKILVVSWEEAADAAATFLEMCGEKAAQQHLLWSQAARQAQSMFWNGLPESFPRFENLKDVLLYRHESFSAATGGFRGIVFAQQRVMTHILEHVIRRDEELSSCFRTACIYATSSPATASLAVTAHQSKRRLDQFASGAVNLLIATSVAEEGMDVPAMNCAICFDPMLNSVSFVQRRGRARQANSAFVVLSEREDRNASKLAEVEQQQLAIVRGFNPEKCAADPAVETVAQRSRERNAREVLARVAAPSEAVAALNLFCKKTKAEVREEWGQQGKLWTCTLSYSSALRSVSAACGQAVADRKAAKREAAAALVETLRSDMSARP
uniref:RNA helicase n=1 Tax=Alexandrium monilatum TaxID=311494 RepID=A0A7S4V2U7_9DINO|mmetsp:Transcript_31111/g.96858  ORF Transcript_31111/g.96858 Transcript_31111/m.96858 type:complete len:619 (+) Transcript_31111:62-1918(+)